MSRVLNILFATLEFSAGTFSGNGVYAQDQVRSLSRLGHRVLVVSGRPVWHIGASARQEAEALIEIPVSKWGRLDHESPWNEFSSNIRGEMLQQIVRFAPDVIVCVDWSALPLCNRVRQYFGEDMSPPIVWSSYRIFTRTADNKSSKKLLQELESECLNVAEASIVLSPADKEFALTALAADAGPLGTVHVLAPHLRQDFISIPPLNPLIQKEGTSQCVSDLGDKETQIPSNWTTELYDVDAWIASRPYFTCCVRLSPEKEPERFVEIVVEMQKRDLFQKHGLRPLICGTFNSEYAQKLRQRLLEAAPESVIVDTFLGPSEMASYFSQTRINVHPCTYDAYGMTIVEAASQEAPSVVHAGDGVGASDFLGAEEMQIFQIDLLQHPCKLVDSIEDILGNIARLAEVGKRASLRARQYTARENAEKLTEILKSVV